LNARFHLRPWITCLAAAVALIPSGLAWGSPKDSSTDGCSPAPPPFRINEPERDLSEVERIVGEVKGLTMGSICGPLTRFDFDSLPGAFTSDARVQQFLPRAETPVVRGRGHQGSLQTAAPGCYGTARDLQADLRSLMDDWVRVERCFFKPFRIFATQEEPRRAVADLHFWLGGIVRGGGRVSEKGDVTAELEQDATGKWRFTRLEFGQRELFRSEAPAFSDWTERAKLPIAWEDQGYDTTDIAFGQILYGGVAVGDYDGDGWSDLYISRAGTNLLLRNRNGNGFEDVTAQAGAGDPGNSQAALFLDLDNDGDLDLFVVNALYSLIKDEHSRRGHVLYRNEGSGRFTRVPGELGPIGPASGVTAADYDRDGLLDLYVTYYQDAKLNPYHHYVEAKDGFGNRLYRNLGGLRFEDVTAQSGAGGNGWSYASAWADFDEDGRIDLFVANDFGDDALYRNRGDGTFEQIAAKAGVADPANGMAADWGDYDNDGKLDLYIANMYSKTGNQFVPLYPELSDTLRQKLLWSARGNSLYRNRGDGGFEETAVKAAVNLAGWAWGSNFFDYDNDGWLDLHVANGFWAGPTEDDA
jgi:hypothetical protein